MPVSTTLATDQDILPLRVRYRAEAKGQIVHDSLHTRFDDFNLPNDFDVTTAVGGRASPSQPMLLPPSVLQLRRSIVSLTLLR